MGRGLISLPTWVGAWLVAWCFLAAVCSAAEAQEAWPTGNAAAELETPPKAGFSPDRTLDLVKLEALVAERSAASERAKSEVAQAQAAARGVRLAPNPVLDGTWGTIPIGTLNPPELTDPLGNVPHYDVGVSYTVPVGKRRPLAQRADAMVRVAQADRDGLARSEALGLAALLGRMATVQLRLAGLADLAAQGAEAITLAEARVNAKFGIPLELDRLRIDVDRTSQQIASAQAELSGLTGACTALLVQRCRPFHDADEAREFIRLWIERSRAALGDVALRPDLRALGALQAAADARLEYARARALPDPTLRLGYTHDRFLVSGNQMNSLSISLSLPVPLFDHGQAERSAALAEREHLAEELARRKRSAAAAIVVYREQIGERLAQQELLERDLIPRAEEMLRSLQHAAESGLVPLTDTLQARRTLGELLLEEAENYGAGFEAALALAAELPSFAVSAR